MNRFLPIILSMTMLLSSFSISPNPFANNSIKFSGFSSLEAALQYYYTEAVDNKISYSKTDQFALLCVLAHLRKTEDVSGVSSALLTKIDNYYMVKDNVFDVLKSWLFNMSVFYGYIVNGITSVNSMENLYKYLSTTLNWRSDTYIDAYAHFFDNIKFVKDGIEPSNNIKVEIENYFTSAAPDDSKYYTLYPTRSVQSLLTIVRPSSFTYNNLYDYFYSDVLSFSAEHQYFMFIPLDYSYSRFYHILHVNNNYYYNFNGPSIGYILLALDFNDFVPVTSSFDRDFSLLDYSLFNNHWLSTNFTDLKLSVLCRFYNGNSYSVEKPDSFELIYPSRVPEYPDNLIGNQTVFKYPGTDLSRLFSRIYFPSSTSYSLYSQITYNGEHVAYSIFSSQGIDFLSFNSLKDFENYTLDNGLFWKATNPVSATQTYITYETLNQEYSTIVNNSTTAYNTVNEYVTKNNIKYVTQTTQNIINNNYTTIYNYDVNIDFDFTINNITNVEEIENNYWNSLNSNFDNSGIADTSFNSFGPSDFSNSVTGSLLFVNSFYNFLPDEIKWAISIMLAVGIFAMLIGAFSRKD